MDAPFLVRRFIREICTTDLNVLRANFRLIGMMLTAFIYIVSPFDLIPEVVFGAVGLIDDFVILIFVLVAVAQGFRQILRNRN